MADSIGPVVVHCSAGIGRTAVLIAVDIGVQGVMQGEAKTDILRIVSTLRQDRAGAVQTRDQYRFIHQVCAWARALGAAASTALPSHAGSVRLCQGGQCTVKTARNNDVMYDTCCRFSSEQ